LANFFPNGFEVSPALVYASNVAKMMGIQLDGTVKWVDNPLLGSPIEALVWGASGNMDFNGGFGVPLYTTGTLPSSTRKGRLVFTTDDNLLRVWTGSTWSTITGGGGGSGITKLNNLTAAEQTFTNDTNVTLSSSGSVHTLGWTGALARARGGTGSGAATQDGQLLIGNTGTGNWTVASLTAGAGISITPGAGSITVAATGGGGGGTAWGRLHVNTTAVGNVGTGEDDLMTYSMPANTLEANGRTIRVTMGGTLGGSAGNKTIKLYFGSAQILTLTNSGSTTRYWFIEMLVARSASNEQKIIATLTLSTDIAASFDASHSAETSTEADTSTIIIKATGEGTSNNDVVQTFLLVEADNAGSGGGSGITKLNNLTAAEQTFTNDTNVTLSSSGSVHTLGWTGALARSRGGTGTGSPTTDGQLLIGNTGTGNWSVGTLTAGANVTITPGAGTITIASSGGSAGTAFFNVKDFGALGNGSANDSAAIASAIAAMPSTGGVLFFPAGDFRIASTIALNKPIWLLGAGWNSTTITQTTANTVAINMTVAGKISDVTISRSVTATSGGNGINTAAGLNELQIIQVRVKNQFVGISAGAGAQNQITACFVLNNNSHGIEFVSNASVRTMLWSVSECVSYFNTGAGYYYTNTTGTNNDDGPRFARGGSFANNSYGTFIQGSSGANVGLVTFDTWFSSGDNNTGLYLDTFSTGSFPVPVVSNFGSELTGQFSGVNYGNPGTPLVASGTGSGITVTANNAGCRITNCEVNSASRAGIDVSAAGTMIDFARFNANGQNTGSAILANRCNIVVRGAAHVSINQCLFGNSGTVTLRHIVYTGTITLGLPLGANIFTDLTSSTWVDFSGATVSTAPPVLQGFGFAVGGPGQTSLTPDSRFAGAVTITTQDASAFSGGLLQLGVGGFAHCAIKAYVQDTSNNTAGFMSFFTRRSSTDGTYTEAARIDQAGTFRITTTSLKSVTEGATDSGGSGFRVLRVPN